jgi:hypothetical protein
MGRANPQHAFRATVIVASLAIPMLLLVGCQSSASRAAQARAELPPDQLNPAAGPQIFTGLSVPEPMAEVEAMVVPPAGWHAEPLKSSEKHNHQVWISPSGNTAYGVIRFKLPLPLGPELVLHKGFLPQMKKTEGEARLISSERDRNLPGLRFVAEGGLYRLRANMITRGWKGWTIYAGTVREKEIVPDELALAELARDHTTVGMPR